MSPGRKKLAMSICKYWARLNALMGGCVWSTSKRVHVDYSKYLGKDYVYRYDRVGVHVCNHIGSFDVVHALYSDVTSKSFMGKKEMLKVPFLGMLVRPLDSILVGRDTLDSKEERGKAI